MNKNLVSINDLPPDGKDFHITDQQIWEQPIKEYKMDCVITTPIDMNVHIQPADEGVLIRGQLNGAVCAPCNRCAETAHMDISGKIEEYEEIPPENRHGKDEEPSGMIVFENHSPMLNLADLAWEQFMLALPLNPLCSEDCKGICPECGANLNIAPCQCQSAKRDPRMEALANVKIAKK